MTWKVRPQKFCHLTTLIVLMPVGMAGSRSYSLRAHMMPPPPPPPPLLPPPPSLPCQPSSCRADYGFEYSDEEAEEEDVDIENQYYNSKGTVLLPCHVWEVTSYGRRSSLNVCTLCSTSGG